MPIFKPYTKKPVTIGARRLTPMNADKIKHEIEAAGYTVKYLTRPPLRAVSGLIIQTKEGNMEADYGVWIIKGIQGEFYPCQDDIFRGSYEVNEEDNGE